jgi:hypothetical protein
MTLAPRLAASAYRIRGCVRAYLVLAAGLAPIRIFMLAFGAY